MQDQAPGILNISAIKYALCETVEEGPYLYIYDGIVQYINYNSVISEGSGDMHASSIYIADLYSYEHIENHVLMLPAQKLYAPCVTTVSFGVRDKFKSVAIASYVAIHMNGILKNTD